VNKVEKQHLQRVKMATTSRIERKDAARWIEQNTTINGRPFSFVDHEYQESILSDDSVEIIIKKSAQTGISEMAMRLAAALVMIMPEAFKIGYTFPTAGFAHTYSKTRFNPIIQGSEALKMATSSDDIDNAEAKSFGVGRELYFKGAASGNAAISTTLDMLIHDELSFSDQEVIGDYHSRVLHSKYKWKIKLSTPTFPSDPIDTEFESSRQHFNFCKCNHCGHQFIPDYYEHVRVPGYTKSLEEITKAELHKIRHAEAFVECPSCGGKPDLSPEHREWVCKNPDENHIAVGYQVSPFDAPKIVTPSSLIIASTSYATTAKFKQFSLGQCAQDAEQGFVDDDIDGMAQQIEGSPFRNHFMGIDLGLYCHFMIGGMDGIGRLGVVHYERVHLSKFRERYAALSAQYRVVLKVSDIQPYTDLIMSLSKDDPSLWGASYVTRNGLDLFEVRLKIEDTEKAQLDIRQVQVNRNAVLDKLLAEGRAGNIWIKKCADFELLKRHLQDMKRASATLRNGEFTSLWQKSSKGQDHYHHALLYLWVAAQMRGVVNNSAPLDIFGVQKFKLKI
jgi:hypothetical protein